MFHPRFRSCLLAAAAVAAMLACSTTAFASYFDLYWDTDPDSLSWGGVAVPGPLVDNPDVAWPTSLPAAGGGQFELELSHQEMAPIKHRRFTAGEINAESAAAQLALPLSRRHATAGEASQWLGLGFDRTANDGWYHEPRSKDQILLDQSLQLRSGAYAMRFGSGWTIGGALTDRDGDLVVGGWTVSRFLDQPRNQGSLPFAISGRAFSLEATRRRGEDLLGVRLSRLTSGVNAVLRVGDSSNTLSWNAAGLGGDLLWRSDTHGYNRFAHVGLSAVGEEDGDIDGEGVSGRNRGGSHEAKVTIGRRSQSPHWQRRTTLSYHRRSVDWRARMDASVLPGFGDRYYMDFTFAQQTISAAYAARRELGSGWYGLGAANLAFAMIDRRGLIQSRSGLFGDMETVLEVPDRRLHSTALLLTGGVGRRTNAVEVRLLAAAALAISTFSLDDFASETPLTVDEDKETFSLGYLFAGTCTWSF